MHIQTTSQLHGGSIAALQGSLLQHCKASQQSTTFQESVGCLLYSQQTICAPLETVVPGGCVDKK